MFRRALLLAKQTVAASRGSVRSFSTAGRTRYGRTAGGGLIGTAALIGGAALITTATADSKKEKETKPAAKKSTPPPAAAPVPTPAAAADTDSAPSASNDSDSLSHRNAAAHTALLELVGADRYSLSMDDREQRGSPLNSYHFSGRFPQAVLYPKSTEEVSAIVKICNRYQIPVIPYGSGTSLEGHTITSAERGGIILDFTKHMSDILTVNTADMDVVVQPGITWNTLNSELAALAKQQAAAEAAKAAAKDGADPSLTASPAPAALFFPVDPGPGASIGGMVATSCSGTNAMRYGTMKHNVLNLTVVLADGTIVKTARRARKSSAGYDLTRLMIGSEGTLGIVTEITLRLQPVPKEVAVAVCAFDTVHDASLAVSEMLQAGVRLGCVELMDEVMMRGVNSYSGYSYPLKPHLFFKFSGVTPTAVGQDIDQVQQIVNRYKLTPTTATTTPTTPAAAVSPNTKPSAAGGSSSRFQWATSAADRDRLWEARKGALWAAVSLRPTAKAWTTDVCVPISRLADCIEQTKKDLESSFLIAPIVGHAGDGNFHVIMLLDPHNPKEVAEAQRINKRMIDRAIAMDGTCTGEHGVGVGKRQYLIPELGASAVDLMKRIKKSLDPNNILNPGKIIDIGTATNTMTDAGGSGGSVHHSHEHSALDCDHTPLSSHTAASLPAPKH